MSPESNFQITRTTSANSDFIRLVSELDKDLAARDGDEHPFFAQYNKIDTINHVVVLYYGNTALACGAIKPYAENTVEVKRMYTVPSRRGEGLGAKVLAELERWATELQFKECIIETGKKMPEAIRLYIKEGYNIIPNYGQYAGVESSVCFCKRLGL